MSESDLDMFVTRLFQLYKKSFKSEKQDLATKNFLSIALFFIRQIFHDEKIEFRLMNEGTDIKILFGNIVDGEFEKSSEMTEWFLNVFEKVKDENLENRELLKDIFRNILVEDKKFYEKELFKSLNLMEGSKLRR